MVPAAVNIIEEDRNHMLIRRNISIPKGSRCCKKHTLNGYLKQESFFGLMAYKSDYQIFGCDHIINTIEKLRTMINSTKHIDFDHSFFLSDADYKNLTGFTRTQHDRVLAHIPTTALKNSINRSPRCTIACLLIKLRLGTSNSVIAAMLGMDNRRKVTDIAHSACFAPVKHFVPRYLGLAHITRQGVFNKHTSSIATRLLSEYRNPCILILDRTYLYIQVRLVFYISCILNLFF